MLQIYRLIFGQKGMKIGCIEEIAYRNGWINDAQMQELADKFFKSGYGVYLKKLIRNI